MAQLLGRNMLSTVLQNTQSTRRIRIERKMCPMDEMIASLFQLHSAFLYYGLTHGLRDLLIVRRLISRSGDNSIPPGEQKDKYRSTGKQ